MSARDRIIGRVRDGLSRGRIARTGAVAVGAYVADHPRGPIPRFNESLLDVFSARAQALMTSISTLRTMDEVPQGVARYLASHGIAPSVVAWQDFEGLPWTSAGVSSVCRPASGADLVGVTGAYCAIAETGSLMMVSGPTTHGSVSLLPETHIAVLESKRIVGVMEDAWALLRVEHGSPPRAVNFISGPSRTADIEQTVTLGAHGPYRVHVILITG